MNYITVYIRTTHAEPAGPFEKKRSQKIWLLKQPLPEANQTCSNAGRGPPDSSLPLGASPMDGGPEHRRLK